MPGDRIFIDSNTLLYALDELEEDKQEKAQKWLTALAHPRTGMTNLEVLNEVTNVLIRKPSQFTLTETFAQIDIFADFGSDPLSYSTLHHARQLHQRFRYSWWDCLLLASALELGCSHFLSEDLQDGQAIEGLTIVDPFAHSPGQILLLSR